MSYSLTVYVFPSPFGVDWRSPLHLARSVVKNAITGRPRTIGHVSIQLEGPGVYEHVGMAAQNFNLNRKLILWDRMGLGVLYYPFPGKLEAPDHLDPEIQTRFESGKFSFVKFMLSQQSFEKVMQYLQEYRQKDVGKIYGLPFRPRYSEGAGCSAFAASFLEVAGVMTDDFRSNCSGQVRIPEAYVGTHLKQGRKVSILKLLFPSRLNARWAKKDEPGSEIFFWDPDMMHRWIHHQWGRIPEGRRLQVKNTKGILVDATSVQPSDSAIWLTDERDSENSPKI